MAAKGKVCPKSPAPGGLGEHGTVTGRICCLTLPCGPRRGEQGVTVGRCLPGWVAAGEARVVVLGWGGRVARGAGR